MNTQIEFSNGAAAGLAAGMDPMTPGSPNRREFVTRVMHACSEHETTNPEAFMKGVRSGATKAWRRRGVEMKAGELSKLPSTIPLYATVLDIPPDVTGEVRTTTPPALWLKSRSGLRQVR